MRGRSDAVSAIEAADEIYLNPVILGELQAGFLRGSQQRKNQRELQDFIASQRVRVADIVESTSHRYAAILDSLWKAGTPIPTNDIWIAATAMQYGLRVVTADAHFLRVPQILVRHLG
jgi:predicted nucleic acid-binding protein